MVADHEKLAADLSEATDSLTQLLAEAEVALKDLNLGVTASVPLEAGIRLAFGKRGGTWRLALEYEDSGDWQPLSNVSRGDRVRAAYLLRDLTLELVKTAKLQIQQVNTAADDVRRFISDIKKR